MYRTCGPYPACSSRIFGLTTRWSSSSSASRGTISVMTCFQNQWAPDGVRGSSVRRLIATRMRSEHLPGDVGVAHERLPHELRQEVHARLVCVLDHAVVV